MTLIDANNPAHAAASAVERLFRNFETHAEARYARRECAAPVVVHESLGAAFVERDVLLAPKPLRFLPAQGS